MPELPEHMYCSQQIVIPPKFPFILKKYAKAAIKTQPYDVLRWSYEYFRAIANGNVPPVKLRLEYPVFSTEGGLTRGYLKILSNQLISFEQVPLSLLKSLWRGACLDPRELKRILCLAEVYLRSEYVPRLDFLAIAGGLLTKSLTHTMILLCETLTKEPEGGSAGIPVETFLYMYKRLAQMDASQDVRYYDGYREGTLPSKTPSSVEEEEKYPIAPTESSISDDYWQDVDLQKISLIDDRLPRSGRLSVKLNMPPLGPIDRSPSVERAAKIERDNVLRERKDRAMSSDDVEEKLRRMSLRMSQELSKDEKSFMEKPKAKIEEPVSMTKGVEIHVYDEDEHEIDFGFYGEPIVKPKHELEEEEMVESEEIEKEKEKIEEQLSEKEIEQQRILEMIQEIKQRKKEREEDLVETFKEISVIVDRFKMANYDLGSVAGRQMSDTSGEFIVKALQQDMMADVDDHVDISPDPGLKKKKANPEEAAMVRQLLEDFITENMDVIVPEIVEEEEEDQPVPDIVVVFAVPGIGAPVEEEIISTFIDYANEVTKVQEKIFMPRNIRHFMCPPLERFQESDYEDAKDQKTSAVSN